jgi:hypothetical protein
VTEFGALGAAAAGMDAQRAALNVAARNVAAAETGDNFARLVPRYAVDGAGGSDRGLDAFTARFEDGAFGEPAESDAVGERSESGAFGEPGDGADPVRFIGTTQEAGNAPDSIAEMVTVLNAERAYEANASVFEAGKRLAERTIDVGRA